MKTNRELLLQLLKNDPVQFNKVKCSEIKEKTDSRSLPLLNDETEKLEINNNLQGYTGRGNNNDLDTFVDLAEAFTMLSQNSKPWLKQKLEPIIKHLELYKHVVETLRDPKLKTNIKDEISKTLGTDIINFNLKYKQILNKDETDQFKTFTPIRPEKNENETTT